MNLDALWMGDAAAAAAIRHRSAARKARDIAHDSGQDRCEAPNRPRGSQPWRSRFAALLLAVAGLAAAVPDARAATGGDEVFANGFEGLGLSAISDRALLPGEALAVQAVASPASLPARLTFSLPIAPVGAAIDASGLVSWTPSASQSGTAAFTVRVEDSAGARAERSFSVAVLRSNTRPRLDPIGRQTIDVGQTLSLMLVARDPDAGDTLAYSRLLGPSALAVSQAGAISWAPSAADIGSNRVRVGVVDAAGEADVAEFIVEVRRANLPPTLAVPADRIAVVGSETRIQLVALDPDAGDLLRFERVEGPDGIAIDPDSGLLTFVPVATQIGRHRVLARVVDLFEASASVAFSISVVGSEAEAGVVAGDDQFAIVAGATLDLPAPGVLANDRTAAGGTLAAVLASPPALGSLQLRTDGGFSYTPTARTQSRQAATTLLSVDFESGIPSVIAPGTASLTGVQGYAGLGPPSSRFGGSFLRGGANVPVTVTLQNLPPHTALDLDFLLAIIDSWDGSGTFPGGDNFEVTVDGQRVFFESFFNALSGQIQTYVPPPGVLLARRVDLAFIAGGFHTDSAYDLGADPLFARIPHTADSVTITFAMRADIDQGLSDESWAIDNLRISIAQDDDVVAVDTFTYRARDGANASAPATARIEVLRPDFAPRILSQPPESAAIGFPFRYDPTALASRPGDTLSWTLDEAPPGAVLGANGRVDWTPQQADLGTQRFRLRVTDPRGAAQNQVFVVQTTAPVVVPDVRGQAESAARASIAARGLVAAVVGAEPSTTVAAGAVLAQSPAANASAVRASTVSLVLSAGPPLAPLPSVVGAPLAAATAVLEQAGFPVATISRANDAGLPPGTVKSQAPGGARFLPAGTPVALTVASGPPVRFVLESAQLAAGLSTTLSAEALGSDGNLLQTQPAFSFTASPEPGLVAGQPVSVSGAVLQTAATTRGRWRIRATRTDTGEFAESLLTIVAPRPTSGPFEAHERFRRLLASTPGRSARLERAARDGDANAIAAIRTQIAADAASLRADLPLLRRASIVAPESGFFPALSTLPSGGFPETPDDRVWRSLIEVSAALVEQSRRTMAALPAAATESELGPLLALDANLRLLQGRLSRLSPSPYSAVAANGTVVSLLSVRIPLAVLADMESLLRLLDAGTTRKFAASLASAAAASAIRSDLMEDLYAESVDHVVNSGIVLALGALLREFAGPLQGMDVITGASQSIHVFRIPGSGLEGSFDPIAELNEVLMIGPDAVVAVRQLLDSINLEGLRSVRDVMDRFEQIADAANGVVAAYEEANSTPDSASSGCLLTDAECVSLRWSSGFVSVNEGGNARLPGPVLILVRNVADGSMSFTTAGFLGQSDPDDD
jgi:hypothetical protein